MSINRINNHPEMVEQDERVELIDRLTLDVTEWNKGREAKPLTVKDAEFWDGDMGIIAELYKGKHWRIGDKVTFPSQNCEVYKHGYTAGEIVSTGMSGDYGSALVRANARRNELSPLFIVPNRDLVEEEPWTDISAKYHVDEQVRSDFKAAAHGLELGVMAMPVRWGLNRCSQFKASFLRFVAKGRTRQDKSKRSSID